MNRGDKDSAGDDPEDLNTLTTRTISAPETCVEWGGQHAWAVARWHADAAAATAASEGEAAAAAYSPEAVRLPEWQQRLVHRRCTKEGTTPTVSSAAAPPRANAPSVAPHLSTLPSPSACPVDRPAPEIVASFPSAFPPRPAPTAPARRSGSMDASWDARARQLLQPRAGATDALFGSVHGREQLYHSRHSRRSPWESQGVADAGQGIELSPRSSSELVSAAS